MQTVFLKLFAGQSTGTDGQRDDATIIMLPTNSHENWEIDVAVHYVPSKCM